jgi:hypothetical protein
MIKVTAGLMLFMVVWACAPNSTAAMQKPVIDEELNVSAANVPASVEAMVADAAAIVIARYTGNATLRELGDIFQTDYSFELLETLKAHWLLPNPTQVFTVPLAGGRKELSAHIVRQVPDRTEELVPRHTYLMFFHVRYDKDVLYPAWGAAAIYDISTPHVRALHRDYTRYDQTPVEEFVSTLRAK